MRGRARLVQYYVRTIHYPLERSKLSVGAKRVQHRCFAYYHHATNNALYGFFGPDDDDDVAVTAYQSFKIKSSNTAWKV